MFSRFLKFLFIFFLSNCIRISIYAQTTNCEVITGKIDIVNDKNLLNINSFSDKTHLKWEKFNVLANEIVRFNQPSENSCVLNQITTSPSKIFGSIESNGKIFLLNQRGILFGKDAKINVASFMASTLNIEDIDSYFENEKMEFQDGSGLIINLGTIEAVKGDVYLISKNIENHGTILAKNGNVSLGSGDKIIIRPKDNQRLYIESGIEDAVIENFGTIEALEVELKSNNPYAFAINHTGIIEAKSIDRKGGRVYLVAKDSKINIKDQAKIYAKDAIETTAEVQILADEIFIQDESIIDISSANGKGNIYIGGGYQGKNPDLITANRTYIGKDVKIHADALEEGNGGEVVVWSDKVTQYYGFISSKGGKTSGDGGLIEVSGKEHLIFEGTIDTKSPKGNIGTLLLDPLDITLSAAADAFISSSGTDPITYVPIAGGASFLSNATLTTALDGANVIVTTNVTGGDLGNITLNGASYTSGGIGGGGLTLNANNNITFSTAASSFIFTLADEADFILNASNDIIFSTDLTVTNAKNITMTADNDFQLNTGVGAENTLDFNFATLISLTAGNDFNVENSGANSSEIIFTTSDSLVINAGNDVKVLGRIENTVQGDISVTATNDINVGPSTSTTTAQARSRIGVVVGDVRINAGNDLNVIAGITVNKPYAQIGYNAAGINSDIYLTVGRNLLAEAGSGASALIDDVYALIGHGGSAGLAAGLKKGNIIINSIGGDCTIEGKGFATGGAECFAQIGHAHVDDADVVVLSGDIRGPTPGSYGVIGGELKIEGGVGTQAYGLMGHGGSNVSGNLIINGDVLVRAHEIKLEAGSAQDTAAGIGHRVRFSGGTPTAAINESTIKVKADTNLLLKAGSSTGDSGAAFIGAYINTTANTRFGIIDIDLIDVDVGEYFTILGGLLSANENIGLIGTKVVNTEVTPQTVTGTSKSNLNIRTGSKFVLVSRSGETIYIQNGDTTTPGRTLTMDINQDLFMQAEEAGVQINTIDTIDLNVARDLSLFADEEDAHIISQNTANINVGRDVNLVGHCTSSGGVTRRDAKIVANTGNMNLFAGRTVYLGPFAFIQALGTGSITTIVLDNDYPNEWDIGPGGLSMDSHSNIDGGTVRIFTATRSNNFIQNISSGNTGFALFVNPIINDTVFREGVEFVDSAIEVWATYYSSTLEGTPFTIFYKDFAMPSILSLLQQDPRIFYPNYELFWKPFYLYKYLLKPKYDRTWVLINELVNIYKKKHPLAL